MQEFEKSNHTKEVELREALDNSDKYIQMNSKLNKQVDEFEKEKKSIEKQHKEKSFEQIQQLEDQLKETLLQCSEFKKKEDMQIKQITELLESNQQWESQTQLVLVDIQKKDIMQEKLAFESQARMRDMATLLK